jgi:YD repeat-containing protein
MINRISGLILFCSLIIFSSCQKESSLEHTALSDSTGIWVLVHKQVNGLWDDFGLTPFVTNAGYAYDTVARTIVYTDTTTFEGHNPTWKQDRMTYDEEGKLVNVATDDGQSGIFQRQLFYSQDGLLEKIITDRDITIAWSVQGLNKVAHSSDPTDNTGPYTWYNHFFTLNEDNRLMKMVTPSIDTAYGDSYEEVERNAGGGVVMRKRYALKNGIREPGDSVVYVREESRPPRFSRFYELLGNGIQWYTNAYGILFIEPLTLYSEYYEYEKNLCNKSTHYETYIDNGQPVTISYIYDFATEYDSNDNPVKQTIYFEGDKIAEVTFTWSRINW